MNRLVLIQLREQQLIPGHLAAGCLLDAKGDMWRCFSSPSVDMTQQAFVDLDHSCELPVADSIRFLPN